MTANVLVAEDLKRHYGKVKALNGASFSLSSGETLAVVGESGCGKSTLARVLTMIEAPTEGRLEIDGEEMGGKALTSAMRRKIQMVFQNPYGSLNPRKTIGATLDEPLLLNSSMTRPERRARALEIMSKVGLRPEHIDRYPHMFSGGQRQRIAVARALILNPSIIVLDEPVSALDLSVQAQVLNMLVELQREFDLAYVFISHDLSVVRHIAHKVMVMYFGRPVETGLAADMFSAPRHPYTRALFSATPVADPTHVIDRVHLQGEPPSPLAPPPGCSFAPRCPRAQPKCSAEEPALRDAGGTMAACFFPHKDEIAAPA